jgi:Domain of unknown function (DUF4747)
MATIVISALNIVIHPHSPERYTALLRRAQAHGAPVRYYGSRVATIGNLGPIDGAPHPIQGVMNTFEILDKDAEWYDARRNDVAGEDDIGRIRVPDHLHPNLRRMNFIFDTGNHTLYFESRNAAGQRFPPRNVRGAFELFLNKEPLVQEYGLTDVTVEPSSEALGMILGMDGLTHLKIHVQRPNAGDDHGDYAARLLARMNGMNAKSQEVVLTKERSADQLEPDEEIRVLAGVAAENGYVEGKDRDADNQEIRESTKDHPRMDTFRFDELALSPVQALLRYIMDR